MFLYAIKRIRLQNSNTNKPVQSKMLVTIHYSFRSRNDERIFRLTVVPSDFSVTLKSISLQPREKQTSLQPRPNYATHEEMLVVFL